MEHLERILDVLLRHLGHPKRDLREECNAVREAIRQTHANQPCPDADNAQVFAKVAVSVLFSEAAGRQPSRARSSTAPQAPVSGAAVPSRDSRSRARFRTEENQDRGASYNWQLSRSRALTDPAEGGIIVPESFDTSV